MYKKKQKKNKQKKQKMVKRFEIDILKKWDTPYIAGPKLFIIIYFKTQ